MCLISMLRRTVPLRVARLVCINLGRLGYSGYFCYCKYLALHLEGKVSHFALGKNAGSRL